MMQSHASLRDDFEVSTAALDELEKDEDLRVIILTGAGDKAFSAGMDLKAFASGAGGSVGAGTGGFAGFARREIPVPVIAAVNGFALGGGCELAMMCDMILAADTAKFGQPEINLGVMPGAGGTQRLTRAVGKTLATEMVLLGRELSGREAELHGLANRAVPAERVLPVAIELARALAKQAPQAVRSAKRAIARAFEGSLHAGLLDERQAFNALLQTDDAREGIAAFLGKRKPTWSGR